MRRDERLAASSSLIAAMVALVARFSIARYKATTRFPKAVSCVLPRTLRPGIDMLTGLVNISLVAANSSHARL